MIYYADTVKRVINSNTFVTENEKSPEIRLEGVPAPQFPHFKEEEAKAYLESLIDKRSVNIEHKHYLHYISICQVRRYSDDLNINQAMLEYLSNIPY